MNKFLLLFVITGLFLVLMVGCQSVEEKALTNKSDKESLQNSTDKQDMRISMYLGKSKYSLSIDEFTLQIKNSGANNYEFGEYYTIEKYQNNAWYEIPFKKNTAFADILYTLESGKTHSQIIYLQGLDYEITKGKYRIIKDFSSNGNKITLETEFDID